MSARTSRLTIDLPVTKHKKLKMAALMMRTTMEDLVLMSVEDFMERRLEKGSEHQMHASTVKKHVPRTYIEPLPDYEYRRPKAKRSCNVKIRVSKITKGRPIDYDG